MHALRDLQGLCRRKQEAELRADYQAGIGYASIKECVVETLDRALGPARERYIELLQDPNELDCLLDVGAESAHETAAPVLDRLKGGGRLG